MHAASIDRWIHDMHSCTTTHTREHRASATFHRSSAAPRHSPRGASPANRVPLDTSAYWPACASGSTRIATHGTGTGTPTCVPTGVRSLGLRRADRSRSSASAGSHTCVQYYSRYAVCCTSSVHVVGARCLCTSSVHVACRPHRPAAAASTKATAQSLQRYRSKQRPCPH